jgi:hypothetical protein
LVTSNKEEVKIKHETQISQDPHFWLLNNTERVNNNPRGEGYRQKLLFHLRDERLE